MIKILRTIGRIIIVLVSIPLILVVILRIWLFIFPQGHDVAENPSHIGYSVGVRIPDYRVTSSSNNLNRKSSMWDTFHYEIELEEREAIKDFDEKLLKKVEKSENWTISADTIIFLKESAKWKMEDSDNLFEDELNTRFTYRLGTGKATVDYWLPEEW